MPAPRVLDLGPDVYKKERGVGAFISELTGAVKNQQDKATLDNILSEYHQNRQEANALPKLFMDLERSNVAPSKRLELQDRLMQQEKLVQERDKNLNTQAQKLIEENAKTKEKTRAEESVYELYKPHMSEEEARRLSKIDTEATARTKVAQFNKPEKKTKFEETVEAEEARKLVKLEEDIPKARDALANLDRIEELSKNELSGVKGFAKAAIGTESAKEMENLSFTAIEPIIKLFNPVGPIPVQKLKIIQNQFQAHAGELQTTINGKINALKRIAQQGLARAEQRVALIRKYKGQVPPEELSSFDKQSVQLQDALVDQEAFNVKLKEAKDTDLVEGFYSKDGKKLKPIPKKEAEKLFEQGLITNVPPI